ncbi:hypothetical protein OH76DRAFT_1484765 [Lentinus brumalis]|uniref:Uncharacterized protein n=1 Tax=Lentinus brumalis TaxID=2498619 RepID=A0A371D4H5_9APHY|nr:hypothetical protein OH76DRAFT_1484765 [Polyporus brumalis]
MAPGLLLTDACILLRAFPQAIGDIVVSLDEDLESVRRRYNLPLDVTHWATFLISRTACCFDTFATTAPYEITHRKALLQELYPGEDALPDRLNAFAMNVNGSYAECRVMNDQFRMLYDGYFLHLNVTERTVIEKAEVELDTTREALYNQVADVLARTVEWEGCLTVALTDKGHRAYMEGFEQRRAWAAETFPRHVNEVLEALCGLVEERKRLSDEASAVWDEQVDGFHQHTSISRVPVPELCSALNPYSRILQQLSAQSVTQKSLVSKLKASSSKSVPRRWD